MTPSDYEVIVDWHSGQDGLWWNETCTTVIEIFGLPGDRFMYHPTEDFMTFTFKSKKDAMICRILLSDRL